MSDHPAIFILIREWFRKYCHEKYNNIPKSVRPVALRELFEVIKSHGYKYDDIGEANFKKIEDHCTVKKKEYKYPTDGWERKALADIRNISRLVFEPEFFNKETPEAQVIDGNEEFDDEYLDSTKYKPLDRSLLKTDVVVESDYDQEFIRLMGVPEEFCE